jgi:hypothetical protein
MARTYVCDCGVEYSPNPKYNDLRVKCNSCVKKTRAAEVKAKAVKYLGGKCVDCNFDGHPVAFDFDHRNPAEKQFKISGKYIYRWAELKRELDRCALRCCRCHRIRHYLEEFGEPNGM